MDRCDETNYIAWLDPVVKVLLIMVCNDQIGAVL